MKIKINKEQILYLNGLIDIEDKKNFLMDCFLGQLEEDFELEFNIKESNVFINSENIPKPIQGWLYKGNVTSEFPNLKLDQYPVTKTCEKIIDSLSKEQLKDITNPINDFIEDTGADLAWNANGTNEFPKGEINLDAFPATDKFFKYVEWASQFYDSKLLQEFLNYQSPHPNKVKRYTKEDLENCFNESRRYRIEPPNPRDRFWRSFEEYLKANNPSN